MEKMFGFLLSVAVLFLFSATQALSQDSALARVDTKSTPKAEKPLTEPATSTEILSESGEAVPQVKFVVPETRDRSSKGLILDNKVGPNGEDIQMDKKGYYFLDDAGKKVRIESKALRDKPKHS